MAGAGVRLAFTLVIKLKAADLKGLAAPLILAVNQAYGCPSPFS
jgi:hypothetical protein